MRTGRLVGHAVPMSTNRVGILLIAAAFALAWLFLFTGASFPNDHFDHLSKARQVVHGEYPIRDFFDSGRPLTIGLSAAALSLSNDTLLAEALLTTGALAMAVAMVFGITWRTSGSILWALWAAGCLLAIEPRLYNYPKVLVSTVGFALALRYLDGPSRARAAALGAWVAIGFLFRHDLAVYLAATTAATLLMQARRDPITAARGAVVVAIVSAAVTAPYLIYLQRLGALTTVAQGGGSLMLDVATITWRGFAGPGDPTWLRHNAENWIYYLFLFVPLCALAAVITRRASADSAARVVPLAVLSLMMVLFLIRDNLDSRLPDVAAPSLMLAGWMLAAVSAPAPGGYRAGLARAGALAVGLVTVLAVMQLSEWLPPRRMARALIRFPGPVTESFDALRMDPLVAWERDGTTDVRGLARWMRECTAPRDRVLVFGYHPEVFFYARRLFPGGMLFLHAGYFSEPDEQRLTVERLQQQSVPFVILEDGMRSALDGTYGIVGAYVQRHYRLATETTFGGPRSFSILRATDLSPHPNAAGLPCLP